MSAILYAVQPRSSTMSKPSPNDPPKPPDKQEKKTTIVSTEIQASFLGPIPPPSFLKGYEEIIPGAAERILAMAETDAQHQREIEFAALNAEVTGVRRGQVLGFFVVLATLSLAAFCAHLGFENAALAIGGIAVVSLASAFVLGRQQDEPKESPPKKK